MPESFITLVTELVAQCLPWRGALLQKLDEENLECLQDSWKRKTLNLSTEAFAKCLTSFHEKASCYN